MKQEANAEKKLRVRQPEKLSSTDSPKTNEVR